MSEQFYSDQEIIQYLLGSLSEAETERLDELSLTDPEFADVLSAAEKDLVDGYVQGELTGAALEKFKSHYLTSPRGREKVELAKGFQVLAEKYSAAPASAKNLAGFVTKPKVADWFSPWSIFSIPRSAAQWGFAAALLMLFAVGAWLLFENTSVGKRHTPSSSIASFVLTPQMRGGGQIQTLSIPAKTDSVTIELELEPIDYPAYEVVLLDQSDNQILWRSEKLSAKTTGNNRALSVAIPGGLFQSRAYLVRVTGVPPEGPSEIVSDYPIQVVKQ